MRGVLRIFDGSSERERREIARRSRDCFWYSPVLKEQLEAKRAEENGARRALAGTRPRDIEDAARPEWELRQHPSTRRSTIGGFVAGGSTGHGALRFGGLAEIGAVLGLRAVAAEPRVLEIDPLPAIHAYGTNAIITEVERWGDKLAQHLEVGNTAGTVGLVSLALVFDRLKEILDRRAKRMPVFNPHTFILEDGGMKDTTHDLKRHTDPKGILNPGKLKEEAVTPPPRPRRPKKKYLGGVDRARICRGSRHLPYGRGPAGVVEAHGPHLPLGTDAYHNRAVLDEAIGFVDGVVARPPMDVGLSVEHTNFAGTLSLSAETALAARVDIASCVKRAGVRKLVLFNSRGGNQALAEVAARRHGRDDELRDGIHGIETSIVHHLKPNLVEDPPRDFPIAERSLRMHNPGFKPKTAWLSQDLNPHGVVGAAKTLSSPEKGATLLDAAAQRVADLLAELYDTDPDDYLSTPPLYPPQGAMWVAAGLAPKGGVGVRVGGGPVNTGIKVGGDKMTVVYTCGKCETRNIIKVNRVSWNSGVVVGKCFGCDAKHLLADNSGLCDETNSTKFSNAFNDLLSRGLKAKRITDPGELLAEGLEMLDDGNFTLVTGGDSIVHRDEDTGRVVATRAKDAVPRADEDETPREKEPPIIQRDGDVELVQQEAPVVELPEGVDTGGILTLSIPGSPRVYVGVPEGATPGAKLVVEGLVELKTPPGAAQGDILRVPLPDGTALDIALTAEDALPGALLTLGYPVSITKT
ncbi:hypothetical protein CTAYLR_005608 [Chrysophaeum taylorii]|uniref:DNL-type domain-containing protein n=1 Tax=Chrysophaeum taylorii TaxID=2483200 RepID=A0AAD7U840_9STRA|nr:hypothetical protein CTAYLR_005608 [Chrysophaeum taylorii]